MFNTSRGLNGAGAILTLLAALLVPWQVALACNTNAWSSVTGAPQAIGPGTNPQGKAYEGDCALTANAGVPAFVTTQFAAEPSVSVRFYLLTEALNVPSSTVTVLSAEDGGTVAFQLQVQEVQGVKELLTRYRDNGSLKNHATRIPLLDTWHGIEVAWTTGAGNGAIEVSFDGMLYLSDKSLVNDGEMVDTLKLGVVQTPFGSGALVVDAVEVRNSGSIGLLEVNELRNISTRADVQSGNDILIAGFIISGDTDKCVVIRARGQSVNVPAGEVRLSDPILQLKSGSTTLDENDNWMDSPEAAIIQALGRAPDHPTDAAIYACLAPGPYSALVRGIGGATGIGIVEVIDADEGSPYLANISTRSRVGTGNLVSIAGFAVRGAVSKQVLVRGRGPTVGVPAGTQRLANPRLRLVDSSNNTIEINDDWQDAANADAINASGRAPTNPLESAILVTLPPGNYTAILTGVGGATGVGIIEVLDRSGGSVESP